MANPIDPDFLLVPRELIRVLKPRDLIVFSLLYYRRNRATGYFWGKQKDICASTGFGRQSVADAFAALKFEEIVEEAQQTEYSEPQDFGATEHCTATKFYKIWTPEPTPEGKAPLLSKAPVWLIALPNRKLCGSAKVLAFLIGGMEEMPGWCGIRSKKGAAAIGISKRQYSRLVNKLSDVGAFESIAQRHRRATGLWLSYSGPSDVRLREMAGRRQMALKRKAAA